MINATFSVNLMRLSCFRLRLLKIHATLFFFLKNKVAYVPYHNLKDYLVSRGGADFFQNSSNLSRKNSLGVGTDVRV